MKLYDLIQFDEKYKDVLEQLNTLHIFGKTSLISFKSNEVTIREINTYITNVRKYLIYYIVLYTNDIKQQLLDYITEAIEYIKTKTEELYNEDK